MLGRYLESGHVGWVPRGRTCWVGTLRVDMLDRYLEGGHVGWVP